ncbi:MAG: response regulator [bacterium]
MFTVLTVDDDCMICDTISLYLTQKGYSVTSAASGEEALEAIDRERPNLVLLDVVMPGMGGEETLRAIKSRYTDLTVIMITVISDTMMALKLLQEGASALISKPINLDLLERNISVWKMIKDCL